jgi:hypothetical protein
VCDTAEVVRYTHLLRVASSGIGSCIACLALDLRGSRCKKIADEIERPWPLRVRA